jgi:hypothetical protein
VRYDTIDSTVLDLLRDLQLASCLGHPGVCTGNWWLCGLITDGCEGEHMQCNDRVPTFERGKGLLGRGISVWIGDLER